MKARQEGTMIANRTLSPGFEFALADSPAALKTCRHLTAALERGALSERNRAQIALAVAQQSGCDYCLWVHTRRASAAGLSGEDIALACAGTAVERRESAMISLACAIAHAGGLAGWYDLEPAQAGLLSGGDIVEVTANVAANILMNGTIHGAAPKVGSASAGARRAA